jgi:exodeoxyribonuclease VII large subunit
MSLRVTGEISNMVRASSGHWYFTLKDERAQVRCAMFRGRNAQVRFRPQEGSQVLCTAKVSLYEGRGDFQLIVDAMQEDGQGQLQQAFDQLKARLQAEGLFAQERKRPIPTHPRTVGVVTSATGAALHDILTAFERRYPGLQVNLYPTLVQGAEAADQIVAAIALANRHAQADVLIVGRGGGSLEDLWPFNEERVARAIIASDIPVVSAVGHEVDFSISDMVADLRAPTPTAAAELLSPDQRQIQQRLTQLQQGLQRRFDWQLKRQRERLAALRRQMRHPGDRIREQQQRCDDLEMRLQRAIQRRFELRRQRLAAASARLELQNPVRLLGKQRERLSDLHSRLATRIDALIERRRLQLGQKVGRLNAISPLATLERGYSLTQTDSGELVRDARQLRTGSAVRVRLQSGAFSAEVTDIEPATNNGD